MRFTLAKSFFFFSKTPPSHTINALNCKNCLCIRPLFILFLFYFFKSEGPWVFVDCTKSEPRQQHTIMGYIFKIKTTVLVLFKVENLQMFKEKSNKNTHSLCRIGIKKNPKQTRNAKEPNGIYKTDFNYKFTPFLH